MTRVLAIDVTGPGSGAALLTPNGTKLARIPPDVPRGRDLVPLVRGLLEGAGLAPADLDLVACATGPGSFTGIRIGIATAATLAYACGLPVLGVGSLHGIAGNAPSGDVLVALDARRGRVFAGRFRDGEVEGGYRHVAPGEVAEELTPETIVLGDARTAYPDALGRFPGTADAPVRPDVIAELARGRFEKGERLRPEELAPLYLRRSDPEIRRGIG